MQQNLWMMSGHNVHDPEDTVSSDTEHKRSFSAQVPISVSSFSASQNSVTGWNSIMLWAHTHHTISAVMALLNWTVWNKW